MKINSPALRFYKSVLVFSFLLGTSSFATQESISMANNIFKGQVCELFRDDQQVLHVRAKSKTGISADLSAVICMGYAHGLDRTFQMDTLRHIFQGRKAEWVGYSGLKQDFFMRVLQFEERAEKIYQGMSPESQKRFSGYAYGVNQGFKEALKKGVWEYKTIDSYPEPWLASQTIAMILLQSFDQTDKGFKQDIKEMLAEQKFGDKAQTLFTTEGLPWDTTVLKKGEYQAVPSSSKPNRKNQKNASLDSESIRAFSNILGLPESTIGIGSNNWILSRSRSETGNAFLANDPHLGLKYPPFWQWMHLQSEGKGGVDMIGASLPGVPIVASGANRTAAWGLTNAYIKAADVSAVNENELGDARSFRPLIWFRFWKFQIPFFFKSFRVTAGGWPVLPLDIAPKGKALVMRWSGLLLQSQDLEMLPELFQIHSVKEADVIFSKMKVPSWNFVFADVNGGIGYRAVGKVPKVESAPPYGVASRSLSEIDDASKWELLSNDEMPHVMNPKRGWLVTANNRHFPVDSKIYGGRSYTESFRAFRIEELLAAKKKHSQQSISQIQCDVEGVEAKYLVPKLMEFLKNSNSGDSIREDIYQDLKEWDYQFTTDCQVCSIYRRWLGRIFESTSLDEGALYRELVRDSSAYTKPLNETLDLAIRDLHFQENSEMPTWGEIHHAEFGNIADDPRLQDGLSIETPGSETSVNPGSSKWNGESYDHLWGASQRMTVEMTNPPTLFNTFSGSNQDLPHRVLESNDSPWLHWRNCEQTKMHFPLNWQSVDGTESRLE